MSEDFTKELDLLKRKLAETEEEKPKTGKYKFKPKSRKLETDKFPQAKNFRFLNPLKNLINKSSTNAKVLARAKKLDFKNQKLKKYIGMPLAAHIDIVHVDNSNVVFVLADSAAWLQRARFMEEDISKLLNQLSVQPVEHIHFKVKRL